MKILALLFSLIISVEAFDYRLVPQKLSEDTYCFFGKLENISKENAGNIVNTCYVQTKEGFVVIDSGPTYAYAQQAYAEMQKIANIPVKYVITTHDHDDHWLGNSFYKHKDVFFIGPKTYEENVYSGMHTRMENALGKELVNTQKIVKLDQVVEKKYTFTLGDKIFEILQPVSQAHTKGDLIVYLEKERIVFTGDLVFNDRLSSLRDGSLLGSLAALEMIDKLDAKIIVGGHGYKTDANATVEFSNYLKEMKNGILKAIEDDVTIDEIAKTLPMSDYKVKKLYDVLHKRNVFDAYRELEMYEEGEE